MPILSHCIAAMTGKNESGLVDEQCDKHRRVLALSLRLDEILVGSNLSLYYMAFELCTTSFLVLYLIVQV